MQINKFEEWPSGIDSRDFPSYKPRPMAFMGHWVDEEWAIKVYGIQSQPPSNPKAPLIRDELHSAAYDHVLRMLPLTSEEGAFYKTGFAVLHEGVQANWLLFQWWTHDDVWCQLLSYAKSDDPLNFKHSTRPIRACVYETAIIWFEQKSWIKNVLNGAPDRKAYLKDAMPDEYC